MAHSIFIPDCGYHNIYHFLVYMLANLRHLSDTPDTIYIDTKQSVLKHNFIIDSLSAIYPKSSLINSIKCPEECLPLKLSPGPLSEESGVSPEAYIFLRDLFLPIIANYSPRKSYSDYIYISRNKDSTTRRIVNENDLFKSQPLSNFEQLTLSELPLLEQMYIFSKAKIIISPHGAALTHTLFCKKDALIIEINSKKMTKLQHFKHIADTIGLRHVRYTKVIATKPKKYASDLLIADIKAFQKYTELAIAGLPTEDKTFSLKLKQLLGRFLKIK